MNKPTLLMASGFSITLQLDGSNDSLDGVFRECDGFDFTQEVIQFREVTNEPWGKASKGRSRLTKLPGNVEGGKYNPTQGYDYFQKFLAMVFKGAKGKLV